MNVINNFAVKSACLIAVALCCTACSDEPRTPTAPTTVGGTVTGLVRGEAPVVSRSFRGHPAVANATVTVIGGPASGTKATTGADGKYEFAGAGTFKLRFEHPSFLASESSETTVTTANEKVSIPEVTLVTAPWTISGLITDRLGGPVPDAEVAAGYFVEGFFSRGYGTARTDAAGRYVVNSTKPRFESVSVGAEKAGFRPMDSLLSARCCGALPDIRLVRIVSITPTAPTSLRVGESVEIPACVVVFDTGETQNTFVLAKSSASAVVAVERSNQWYAMRGGTAGVATLTFDLWGAVATIQVNVR